MRAAEVALAHLRDAHAENWLDAESRSPESWYQDVLHALGAVNDAILAAHRPPDEKPRTTLAFAFARPREDLLVLASAGDSHLFVAGATRGERGAALPAQVQLPGQREAQAVAARQGSAHRGAAAGRHCARSSPPPTGSRNSASASPIRAQAVTDAVASADAAAEPARASVAARALLDAALAAHVENDAGDNVAVAVAWL